MTAVVAASPPEPPNPSEDTGLIPRIRSAPIDTTAIPSPPGSTLQWDVNDILPETAMKMLCRSVQALAAVTGDVPPTPPISRPTTPSTAPHGSIDANMCKENQSPSCSGHKHKRSSSRPATPVPSHDIKSPSFRPVSVGSPEASKDEPAAAVDADCVG